MKNYIFNNSFFIIFQIFKYTIFLLVYKNFNILSFLILILSIFKLSLFLISIITLSLLIF